MVVYALIWIKLPTALSLLAKNSPSSSRLWLHSNYTADWNEPARGGRGKEPNERTHTRPSWPSNSCPWDPESAWGIRTCGRHDVLLSTLDKTLPKCIYLEENDGWTARHAQVPAGSLNASNVSNKFLLFSSIVGTQPRNLYFSPCIPSLDLLKFPHWKI